MVEIHKTFENFHVSTVGNSHVTCGVLCSGSLHVWAYRNYERLGSIAVVKGGLRWVKGSTIVLTDRNVKRFWNILCKISQNFVCNYYFKRDSVNSLNLFLSIAPYKSSWSFAYFYFVVWECCVNTYKKALIYLKIRPNTPKTKLLPLHLFNKNLSHLWQQQS